MQHRIFSVTLTLLLASCSFSMNAGGSGPLSTSRSSGTGPSTAPAHSHGAVPMPDLLGKTPEEAQAILRAAGFDPRSFGEETTQYTCDYDRLAKPRLFTICRQSVTPGQSTPVRAPVRYTLERSAPGRGNIGTQYEYVLMPDVFGKSLDEARQVLAGVGLPLEQHFDIQVASAAERCEPEVICYTSPGRNLQKRLTGRGTITVGRPRSGTH